MRNIFYKLYKVENNKRKLMSVQTKLKNILPIKEYFEHFEIVRCNYDNQIESLVIRG